MTDDGGTGRVRGLLGRLRGTAGTPDPADEAASAPPTTQPPAEVEPTHLGPVMDEAVARVRGRMRPPGEDADYDLARDHLDLTHFLLQARHHLEASEGDALGRFLDNGARAKASPEVNVDLASYLRRHPERADGAGDTSPYVAWLREGRDAGEIADPAPGLEEMATVLGRTPHQVAEDLGELRSDLVERLRTGTLGEMFARAAQVEPLIGEAWMATTQPVVPPVFSEATSTQVHAVHAAQTALGFARARVVIVAPEPRWGGGRRAEGHLAHALARHIEAADVVVVYTDAGGQAPPGRFPDEVRELHLAPLLQGLSPDQSQRVLVELLRSLRADAIVNINSRLLHEGMSTYGRALAATERIFPLLFCNEQLAMGAWVGLPLRFFYRWFDQVAGVLTDSEHLVEWLRNRHQLGPEAGGDRLHVLRAPVDTDLPQVSVAPRADDERPRIYWAGRWDRQKRVDLALEVARRLPEVDVLMWGAAVLGGGRDAEVPDNVTLQGAYAHITELDLEHADAWLYTSAWDGVPSQLLEVGMTGVPIVGSLVGGTGEVLPPEHAWGVAGVDDPDAYVAAIREVLADPAEARRRAAGLRGWLEADRDATTYADRVASLLLLEGDRR